MRKEWRKFLQFILTVFLILVVFGFGTRIVNAEENREAAQSSEEDAEEDTGRIQQEVEDALLSEFDFDEIEDSLRRMFPREKISLSGRGEPGVLTLAGPPEKMIPLGAILLTSSALMENGTIWLYTPHSLTRLAMSWLYWAPKSRTITESWFVMAIAPPSPIVADYHLRLSSGLYAFLTPL